MTDSEANRQALARLERAILRRHGRQAGRAFVVLAVKVRYARPKTDDLATQPLRVLRVAR